MGSVARSVRLAFSIAVATSLAAGCTLGVEFEPEPHEADARDGESDLAPDTASDAADTRTPCSDVAAPCTTPGLRCSGDTLELCAVRTDGCLELTTTDCAATAGGTCDETGPTPACTTDPCAGLVQCQPGSARCEDADTLLVCTANAQGCFVELATECPGVVAGGICDASVEPAICTTPRCAGVANGCSEPTRSCADDGTTVLACAPDPAQDDCLVLTPVEDCAATIPGGYCGTRPATELGCVDPCPDCPALRFANAESPDLHLDAAAVIHAIAADADGVLVLGETGSGFELHCLDPMTLLRERQALAIEQFVPASGTTIALLPGFAIVPGSPTLFVDRASCSLFVPTMDSPLTLESVAPIAGGATRFFGVRLDAPAPKPIESFEVVLPGAPQTDIDQCLVPATAPCVRSLCGAACEPIAPQVGATQLLALPEPLDPTLPQELVLAVRNTNALFWWSYAIDPATPTPTLTLPIPGDPGSLAQRVFAVDSDAFVLRTLNTTLIEVDRATETDYAHSAEAALRGAAAVEDDSGTRRAIGLLDTGELRGLEWTPRTTDAVLDYPLAIDTALGSVEHLVAVGDILYVVAADRVLKLMAVRRNL